MNESILNSIKKYLGIDQSYNHFDQDIIMNINAALSTLTQLGVGPSTGFSISSSTETWGDFIGSESRLEIIKQYVYLQTRMVFDPPSNSTVINAYNTLIEELKWRINAVADYEIKD